MSVFFPAGRLLSQASPCVMKALEKFLGMKLYVYTLAMNRGVFFFVLVLDNTESEDSYF